MCFRFDLPLKEIKRIEINERFAAMRLVSSFWPISTERTLERLKKS